MKKPLLSLLLLVLSAPLFAQPLWMRYPSISPDGKRIAFAYKGDIYTVDSSGGKAQQLTTGDALESYPIWSPDSKKIAFTSDRYANNDIFIVSSEGGEAKRLTTNSYSEIPTSFTPNGDAVLFTSSRNSLASDVRFPAACYTRTYKISVNGGREELVMAAPSTRSLLSKDGTKVLYANIKGGENEWRKHHTSSVARDIMLYDRKTDNYKKLTTNIGEDRDPVFSSDGKTVYYLSEQPGKTFNVYSFSLSNPDNIKKISNFNTHPLRFLSIAKDDLLCYGYMGEIYTQSVGGAAKKVKIEIANDTPREQIANIKASGNLGSFAVSADGSQVAYTIRGELYVTSVDFGMTKRITNTPAAENGVTFIENGRALLYGSDRSGVWNIYKATIARDEEVNFAAATLINEEPLFKPSQTDRMLPTVSPDGKEIAYIEDRNKLMVYNLESKKSRMITNGDYHFTNTVNGFSYEWSPNSKWFAITFTANQHNPYNDIGIVSAEGGEIYNLTESGYMSGNPKWSNDGTYVLFRTEKYGMRNHASWGSLNDIMIAFVNQDAYDKYRLTEKEYDLMKAEEKHMAALKKKAEDAEKAKNGKKEEAKTKEEKTPDTKEVEMELENIKDRIVRLTSHSSELGSMISCKDGSSVMYISNGTLYSKDLKTKKAKSVQENAKGTMIMNAENTAIFMCSGTSINKYPAKGDGKPTNIPYSAYMQLDKAGERAYMFNHVYTQELKRFYEITLHGVDWAGMKKAYEPMLEHINNNKDFAELLSEMLGELNVSHTGGRYYPTYEGGTNVAELGLFFDETYTKDGLKVEEVIEGGPFDKAKSSIKRGDIITEIDGQKIKAGEDYYLMLDNKSGSRVLVGYKDATGQKLFEVIKPISKSALTPLLYERWVKWQTAETERLSGGRLGYVHIKSMNDDSFRKMYSDVLGKYNHCEAIIIDTRNNGGGRLHEDVEAFFTGKKYLTQVIRDKVSCEMPSRRWNKPSIMIMNEANYSNAHGTPWVYKHTGIGSLVGMPVPGTMTSVTWEKLQDQSLVFGIPQVGYKTAEGNYLENTQLEPDFKVELNPAVVVKGRDEQLEKAVSELLKNL